MIIWLVQDRGIVMFAVGITNAVDMDEIRLLASNPAELNTNYWLIEQYSELNGYASALAAALCSIDTPATVLPTVYEPGICFVLHGLES